MADEHNDPERPKDRDGRSEASARPGGGSPASEGRRGPHKAPLPPERRAPEVSGETEASSAADASPEGEEAVADGPTGAEEGNEAPAASEKAEQSGRARLLAGLWPPRVNRNQLVVALLLFVLGLGLAIQVRQTSEDSALRGARQEDLVRILDELDDRTTRLDDEKQRLEKQRSELENSSDQAEEARKQTEERERQLGVLAGTVAAEGPGIHFEVGDPSGAVEADKLLDAIQELRAAGAEAIQVNDVRVVAGSYFSDADGGVRVDGRKVSAPYRFDVIGKPQDLEPALNIPGGIVQTLAREQATVTIEQSDKIVVDALRTAKRPDYAQSS